MRQLQLARRGARVSQARVCASSPQTANAVAHLCAPCEICCSLLEATASTFEHGLASRKRGFSLVQYPFAGHGSTTTSAARRARDASARAAPPPHRQPTQCCASSPQTANAVARLRAPRESRLLVGGRSWHVGAWSYTDEEGLLAGAVPFRRALADYNQRGTARARRKRTCCAYSPQTANAVARLRAPRERRLLVGGRSWNVGAWSCTEGERLLAGAVNFRRV